MSPLIPIYGELRNRGTDEMWDLARGQSCAEKWKEPEKRDSRAGTNFSPASSNFRKSGQHALILERQEENFSVDLFRLR